MSISIETTRSTSQSESISRNSYTYKFCIDYLLWDFEPAQVFLFHRDNCQVVFQIILSIPKHSIFRRLHFDLKINGYLGMYSKTPIILDIVSWGVSTLESTKFRTTTLTLSWNYSTYAKDRGFRGWNREFQILLSCDSTT